MIRFVDSGIADKTKETDINQRYHVYFEEMKSYISEGILFPALFTDSVKHKFLETLDDDAFDAVWRMDEGVRPLKYRDTILTDVPIFKSLELNYQGK